MQLENALQLLAAKLNSWLQGLILSIPNILAALFTFLVFLILARIVRQMLHRALRKFPHSQPVNNLVTTIAYLSFLLLGVFVALGVLNLDKTVTSLLAGAGILGLAIAFAFRDVAENFISGIYMSIRHPFRIGDLIQTNDFFGVVEEISLRNTVLATPEGQRVLLPNSIVFQKPLVNYSFSGTRRVDFSVGVSYSDDLPRAKETAAKAVTLLDGRDPEREPEVFYTEFGDSSINMIIRIWIKGTSQKEYLAVRSEAIMKIKTAFDAANISIPFPIRTLDIRNLGGQSIQDAMQQTQ